MSNKALSAKHEPLVRIVKAGWRRACARRILVRVVAIVLASCGGRCCLSICVDGAESPGRVPESCSGGSFGSKHSFLVDHARSGDAAAAWASPWRRRL